MRNYLIFFAACALLLSVSCKSASSGLPKKAGDGDIRFESASSDAQMLEIRIPGNPTTGYIWRLKSFQGKGKLDLVSTDFTQDKAEEGMVGVGGTFNFHYRWRKKGESRVTYWYVRPWENEGDAPVMIRVDIMELAKDGRIILKESEIYNVNYDDDGKRTMVLERVDAYDADSADVGFVREKA